MKSLAHPVLNRGERSADGARGAALCLTLVSLSLMGSACGPLILLRPPTLPSRHDLAGAVLSHAGEPCPLGHGHLDGEDVEANSSGRFKLSTRKQGLVKLELTGLDSASHSARVWLEQAQVSARCGSPQAQASS